MSLDVFVSSPVYKTGNRAPVKSLDVSSTYDAKTGSLFLNVLNRSKSLDITADLENQSGKASGAADVWEMNNADLKATHTFGADMKVRPVMRTVNLQPSGPGFKYTFPAHSLTILKLKIS